jgi:hypothetical protein
MVSFYHRPKKGLKAYFTIIGYAASIIGQVLGQPQFFESFNLAQDGPGLAYTNSIIGRLDKMTHFHLRPKRVLTIKQVL